MPGTQRDDECVRLLHRLELPLTVRPVGQGVRQLAADPLGHAGSEQETLVFRRHRPEHFLDEVLGDGSLVARELLDSLGVPRAGCELHGQPEPDRPALGPLYECPPLGCRQADGGLLEQFVGLGRGECQLGGTDLGEIARRSQPVKAQPWVGSRNEHQMYGACVVQRGAEPIHHTGVVNLLPVIQDEGDGLRQLRQADDDPLQLVLGHRCREREGPQLAARRHPTGSSEGGQDVRPEHDGVVVVRVEGHPGDRVWAGPGPARHQLGLAPTGPGDH